MSIPVCLILLVHEVKHAGRGRLTSFLRQKLVVRLCHEGMRDPVCDAVDDMCLRSQGVKVKEVEVLPIPLSPTFMADRVDDFGLEASKAVYEALQDGGAVNATGYLVSDPR